MTRYITIKLTDSQARAVINELHSSVDNLLDLDDKVEANFYKRIIAKIADQLNA